MSTPALPEGASVAIAHEAMRHGLQNVETGGFLLASRAGSVVDVLAHTGEQDIERHERLLIVGEAALEALFDWADERELYVCAQWHSHRGEAFLSRPDREHGFSVEGFVTSVLPHFHQPPSDPGSWGWWTFCDGDWLSTPSPSIVPGAFSTIYFDASGIRDA